MWGICSIFFVKSAAPDASSFQFVSPLWFWGWCCLTCWTNLFFHLCFCTLLCWYVLGENSATQLPVLANINDIFTVITAFQDSTSVFTKLWFWKPSFVSGQYSSAQEFLGKKVASMGGCIMFHKWLLLVNCRSICKSCRALEWIADIVLISQMCQRKWSHVAKLVERVPGIETYCGGWDMLEEVKLVIKIQRSWDKKPFDYFSEPFKALKLRWPHVFSQNKEMHTYIFASRHC